MSKKRVIVVGAGPVGLVAATYLVSEGIPVLVVETHREVPEDLRASTFHPPTLDLLDRFGITQTLIDQGLVCRYWQFRDRKQGAIVTFDLNLLAGDTKFPYRLQCEQWKLTRLLRARLNDSPDAEFIYGARATGLSQDADAVTLTVEHEDGSQENLEGRYVIGADGARSAVRKSLPVEFEGMTIPELYLSLSTTFRFDQAMPDIANINYLSDPSEWLVLLRTPSLWRVLLPTDPNQTDAEMMASSHVQKRLQSVVPSDTPYEVVHKTAYRVHERVASRYVVGRAMLIGDAAHLNNPLGGRKSVV